MLKSPWKNTFSALPPYFGGKRKLIRWIFGNIAQVIPAQEWERVTLLDALLGGGSISFYAKAQGFQKILANDISERSQILGQALLVNQKLRLTETDLHLAFSGGSPDYSPGFIRTHYTPDVFSTRHAQLLDGVLSYAHQSQDPIKKALLLTLLWHLASEFVCFPTSLGTSNRPYAEALDGLRTWEGLNPKRFSDGSISHLLQPTFQVLKAKGNLINRGILGGSPVQLSQQDAITFVGQNQGEILYLDPPYAGTLSYEKSNQVLDSLLTRKLPIQSPESSPFSKSSDALAPLLESARHIPIWVLSYGNKEISLEDLVALVKRHAGNRTVQGFSKKYRHLAHVSKSEMGQELLVLAYP